MGVVLDVIFGFLLEVRRTRQLRATERSLIPYHPVLAGMYYAAALVSLVAASAFLVMAVGMVNDDLFGIVAIAIVPFAISGLAAAIAITGGAVKYGRRRP